MVGVFNTCKGFVLVKFPYLLEGDVIRYGRDVFYNCRACLLNKNVSLNEQF